MTAKEKIEGSRLYVPVPEIRDVGKKLEEEIRPGFLLRWWEKLPRHYQLYRIGGRQIGIYKTRLGAEKAVNRMIQREKEDA